VDTAQYPTFHAHGEERATLVALDHLNVGHARHRARHEGGLEPHAGIRLGGRIFKSDPAVDGAEHVGALRRLLHLSEKRETRSRQDLGPLVGGRDPLHFEDLSMQVELGEILALRGPARRPGQSRSQNEKTCC
jgi:hypothetical protein